MELVLLLLIAGVVGLVVVAAFKHQAEEKSNLEDLELHAKKLHEDNFGAVKLEPKEEVVDVEPAVEAVEAVALVASDAVVASDTEEQPKKKAKKAAKKKTAAKTKSKPDFKVAK